MPAAETARSTRTNTSTGAKARPSSKTKPAWNLAQTLAELESAGTAQNRKVYARHGFPENIYGVSFANFGKLKKAIGTDHALAAQLWATGNADARLLACMIADPEQATSRELDAWVKDVTFYSLGDALAQFIGKTRHLLPKIKAWTPSKKEWIGQTGWNLVAVAAMNDPALPESFFEPMLDVIAAQIHQAPNYKRHAMNQALIAIGVRSPALTQQALAVAAGIGKVEVHHGQTSCKTPDAAAYIQKTLDHMKKTVNRGAKLNRNGRAERPTS